MLLDPQDASRLRDVVTYGEKVQLMIGVLSYDEFLADTKTVFAVSYGIQAVGEAAWKVSDELKKTTLAIPWPL